VSNPRRCIALVLLGALTACSGPRVPLAFNAERCTPDATWPAEHEFFEYEVIRLVNEHRAGMGLPALERSVSLQKAAGWKARHMAYYRYFTHDDPTPPTARTYDERIRDCGYEGKWPGENIAGGDTPQQAMNL
jgi:uncharacterized protein YkwD